MRERRESTQRLGRSEGDTIENNDNEGGGAEMERGEGRRGRRRYMLSYTSPKGNFHPTHKGREQGRVVLRKVWIVCVSMHMCASLLKLADFVAGWWLSDRAREAEWQEGISIWNFNKDRKGKRCQPARWCERCVCLTMFALCTRACVLPSPPEFGNLIWGMLTRTKDGLE